MNIDNFKCEKVFDYFKKICTIPHGSGNTKGIAGFLIEFAKAHNFKYYADEYDNVIIYKDGQNIDCIKDSIILQSHTDMVCEKDADKEFDFSKDEISLIYENGFFRADKTTLGADNGIGVSIILSILDDKDISHPPIEAVFTSDEEVGLIGAEKLDITKLKSKKMINIDSDREGIFTLGCAGGCICDVKLDISKTNSNNKCYEITVTGLLGGHSGVDIDKGRINANSFIIKLLNGILHNQNIRLISFDGGTKDNVITPYSSVKFSVSDDAKLKKYIDDFINSELRDYKIIEPYMELGFKEINNEPSICEEESDKIISFLSDIPTGVLKMSEELNGLVESSVNLGVVKTTEKIFIASYSIRDNKNQGKDNTFDFVKDKAKNYGFNYTRSGDYPAWEYNNSNLCKVSTDVYKKMYNKEPQIISIHAGLECGIFSQKIDNFECISIGPDLYDIHTTRERVSVESVSNVYQFITENLKSL